MQNFKLVLLALVAVVGSFTVTGQEETVPDLMSTFLRKSEYVHKVVFQLLFAHTAKLDGTPISEPMKFDNFTYSHFWLFQDGESHTYDPLLFGFADSTLTIDVNNDTYQANVHMVIPQASLTGTYDLWMDTTSIFPGGGTSYRGAGAYAHTFRNVEFWLNLTITETEDTFRAIPTNVHTSLHFDSCNLWAQNFTQNGQQWNDQRWLLQSQRFKEFYEAEEKSFRREILLTESAKSYFGIYWGFLDFSKDAALGNLIDLGGALNP